MFVVSTQNLGVIFDDNFNFRQHISRICRTDYYHMHDLRRIRWYLPLSVAQAIVTVLVTSRLDCCNFLSQNCAFKNITKLHVKFF